MEQVLTVPFPYLVLDRRVATCPDIEQITLIFSVHIRIVVLVVSRVTTKQVMADKGNNPQLENQASFISIIMEYPVILENSNIPSIKNKRNRAIEEIQNRIDNELGLHLDSSQILKKLNNMKRRVKSKADTNKTGNMKVILKPWEEDLLNFIEGDTENPAIVRLKGAVTAVTEETQNENSVSFDSSVDSTNFETSSDKTIENRPGETLNNKKLKLIETEETKDLTLPELRLVLLKQLEYFKKAEKLVDIQLKREESKEIDQPQSKAPSEQNGISTEELQTMIGTSYSTTYCDGLEQCVQPDIQHGHKQRLGPTVLQQGLWPCCIRTHCLHKTLEQLSQTLALRL
ncbi:hypothetical protein J6590_016761 [Homalodisca vitripennis]|nr:hypothetical protein J6590_069933 [Homalodisca vitripennis]KAG8283494.1 hypothetical protein J6590_016761 [Homalodisca vitripennis]